MEKPATYSGRLVCDGDDNLLASEGDWEGHPVAFHEGSYVFVQPGEPSHNQRHQQNVLVVNGTVSAEDLQNPEVIAELERRGASTDPADHKHHEPGYIEEDDPHYHPTAPNNIKLLVHPDAISPMVTSHTEAYKNG